jgi:hypothetical protein
VQPSSLLPQSTNIDLVDMPPRRVTHSQTNMAPPITSTEDGPLTKRRKIRKSTQGCWDCKRRKVRCTWAMESNTICDNCIRRNTTCTSQEHIEDEEIPKKSNIVDVEARLRRVEDVLQQLVDSADATHRNAPESEVPEVLGHLLQTQHMEVRYSWHLGFPRSLFRLG